MKKWSPENITSSLANKTHRALEPFKVKSLPIKKMVHYVSK